MKKLLITLALLTTSAHSAQNTIQKISAAPGDFIMKAPVSTGPLGPDYYKEYRYSTSCTQCSKNSNSSSLIEMKNLEKSKPTINKASNQTNASRADLIMKQEPIGGPEYNNMFVSEKAAAGTIFTIIKTTSYPFHSNATPPIKETIAEVTVIKKK